MSRVLMGVTTLAALVALSVTAHALSVTNRDSAEHSLRITEGSAERTVMIQPDETLSDVCIKDCTIALEDGEAKQFDGTESVTIKGDNLTTTIEGDDLTTVE